MRGAEEETYSIIFTALRHPVRRRILRMLSSRSQNFSQMLGTLRMSSSHLTYHLDSLGDLVFKGEDGVYRLSVFGEAAVSMMYQVEEAPKTPRRLPSLTVEWKALFAVLIIGLVILSGFYFVQHRTLSQMSAEYADIEAQAEQLENNYNQAKVEVEQLLNELDSPEHFKSLVVQAKQKELKAYQEYEQAREQAQGVYQKYRQAEQQVQRAFQEYKQGQRTWEEYLQEQQQASGVWQEYLQEQQQASRAWQEYLQEQRAIQELIAILVR